MVTNKQKGIAIIPVLIVVGVFLIAGAFVLKSSGDRVPAVVNDVSEIFPIEIENKNEKASCPDPFIFPLPIDITKATSILYPGQIRGGDFKAHGGFRFENSLPSDILVTAPIDAKVVAGARYPVYTGDIQYTFDFEHPCGIRYRLGHLLTLSPKFQAIAEKFPLPIGMDSRTTEVHPAIEVKQGEVLRLE